MLNGSSQGTRMVDYKNGTGPLEVLMVCGALNTSSCTLAQYPEGLF